VRHPNRRSTDRHVPASPDDPESGHGRGVDPGLLTGTTDEEILRSYLHLVRTWRGAKRRDTLRLRQADVAVLVSILGTDDAEIERHLMRATACTPRVARYGRLLLFASVGALSLQLTGAPIAGALPPMLGARTSAPAGRVTAAPPASMIDTTTTTPTTTAPVTTTSVTRTSVTTAPVTTAAPTDAETPPAGEQAPPATTAGPVPASAAVGAGTALSIPSVGIDLPVVDGGQAVIDRGVVAHYMADGWEPPVAAGAVGTYWLAAHHLTHGAPFADLPDIAIGAEIRVVTRDRTFVYTVTSKEVVGLYPGDAAVYGTDPDAAVILLQTCSDSVRRVLVHGVLTATE
jgi:LPXTG-site transpeptidase (sortase) family protein